MTLISRKIFFDNPDRLTVKLNPKGTSLSFIAPVDGVLNIWIADPDHPENAKSITFDKHRGIRSYSWTYVDDLLLYVQDTNGDENFHIYALNSVNGEIKDLTPFDELHAQILHSHRDRPSEIMVGLNNRRKDLHDVYRLNLISGELTLVYENDTYAGFVLDDHYTIVFGVRINSDGGASYDRFIGGKPQPFTDVPADDVLTTSALGLRDKDNLYWVESRNRNTAALYNWHLPSGDMTLLAENEKADIEDVLMHPTTKAFEGAASNYLRKEWTFEKGAVGELITHLNEKISGDLEITSRTTDDTWWIVAALEDQGPVQYYRIQTQTRKIEHLFSGKQSLENLNLRPMEPVIIQSRDGLPMVSYMTRPATSGPVPFVLMVHGGPNARDSWGYNGLHQWLANRGYGVLSVNYRGSTGFGKKFIMAGNGEWSRKMHDDLIDAVEWLIAQGHAPRNKIAIMGGSYGGYATLVGLTFTPDVFACGIDIVGPSNLKTLMETIPPYWKPALDILKRKLGGDLDSPQGLKELADRSPLHRHQAIKKPLLIGQGAHDPRVKQAEADQIVNAMVQSNIPITYVIYPDEGHGFARPENRLSFYAITEAFLAKHLGGQLEPIGNDFEGSSLIIEKDTAGVIEENQSLNKKGVK